MRLSRIKLAGFKSFVDPTTFQLPSNLVGIVGPNGCGKSNVIDAVRWVMGEMSAKHLRGDSMSDVIFNGSASRKPVGTASIELFFDNSDGSIGGQYAQYAEISLKRMISRDGTSSYFLNNTRCRRKDITDLFLGTGLGSRSYAIIEQGMVSRLVDAKPDEMRNYIEEAAGISKYKERRRETETRIQHTRDNLARLGDLREEITKQLEYLQRQAKAAERYKEFKGRERRLDAEVLALRIAEIDRGLEAGRADLTHRQTEFDGALSEQRRLEAEIVRLREAHVSATESFNRIQSRYYAVQSEISRLEQAISHARELRDRQQADLRHTQEQAAVIRAEMARDSGDLEELERLLRQLAPELEQARAVDVDAAAALRQAEGALQQSQAEWQQFNLAISEMQQTAGVERTRAEHLAVQVSQLQRQSAGLDQDRSSIALAQLEDRLRAQAEAEQRTGLRATALQADLDELRSEEDRLRAQDLETSADLENLTNDMASHRGQISAIEALQQAALGGEDAVLSGWLSAEHLAQVPRLAQQLRVDERWVLAVETVLGDFLQAVCVEGAEKHLGSLPDAPVVLIEHGESDLRGGGARGRLLEHVANPGQTAVMLSGVHTASDIDDAIRQRRRLAAHESVITPDGIWLGRGWVRVNRGQRSKSGLLTREQRIREIKRALAEGQQRVSTLEVTRETVRGRLAAIAEARGEITLHFNAANREHAEALAVLEGLRAEISRARERQVAVDQQLDQLGADISTLCASLAEAREKAERATSDIEVLSARRQGLQHRQEQLSRDFDRSRDAAEVARANVARLSINVESRRVARESAAATLTRLVTQIDHLEQRATMLDGQVAEAEPAIQAMQEDLSGQLEQQLAVNASLGQQRDELEQVECTLRASEGARAVAEKSVNAVREAVDELRLHVRELEVRRESLIDSMAANGADLEAVLREMPADAEVGKWQESLDEVRRKIDRLGPINLAAIEQFSEQSERKKYLDAQNEDLAAALDTLEQAIRKIDRETRSRFQETFDNVNQGLKRIFPRLFGGGHAYLSLEGDDVLAAGVTVMARPPGKRNSHIHLLSGGEKALTAVALIFSIFELNPAPFCLLDEVDAPLDEANVSRFCDIVREMSQRVQFVVITHNKTTMEMANQLTGVTMNEPGVSRLVSVDLDAAVQLAAS